MTDLFLFSLQSVNSDRNFRRMEDRHVILHDLKVRYLLSDSSAEAKQYIFFLNCEFCPLMRGTISKDIVYYVEDIGKNQFLKEHLQL